MSRRGIRWFLPESPDVVGMLQEQAAITVNGMQAFAAWAGGDSARGDDVRVAEHDCDEVRRKLVDAVSEAFTTPLQPEDLFQLSRDLDKVINGAKNIVRESEAMAFPPDRATADMAVLLGEGAQHIRTAFASLDERRSKHAPPATRPPTPRLSRSAIWSASIARPPVTYSESPISASSPPDESFIGGSRRFPMTSSMSQTGSGTRT